MQSVLFVLLLILTMPLALAWLLAIYVEDWTHRSHE